MSAGGPRFDYDRFGIFHRGSPRQCRRDDRGGHREQEDGARAAQALYDQMPEPKWVIAMGACACTGGPFREYPNVDPGRRQDRARRRLRARLPAAARVDAVRVHAAAGEDRATGRRSALMPDATRASRCLAAAGVAPRASRRRSAPSCASSPATCRAALGALRGRRLRACSSTCSATDTGEAIELTYHLRDARARLRDALRQGAPSPYDGERRRASGSVYPAALFPEREAAELLGMSLRRASEPEAPADHGRGPSRCCASRSPSARAEEVQLS